MKTNEKQIIHFYDSCQGDFALGWHLDEKMSIHYGYWDESTRRLRESLDNMNIRLSAFGEIKPGDYVLDAGCGVGGSSIFLAKSYGCKTVGITLSEKQVATARENAKKHQVEELCTFDVQNYLHTSFSDNTFDVVWAIESICYAPDKLAFLREAFRVLKPGGRLVLADIFATKGNGESELLKKMGGAWAIDDFALKEESVFWELLEEAGFVARRRDDVTSNVVKSIQRMYKMFFFGLPFTYLMQAIGMRNSAQTGLVWSSYYQYRAYKKNLWKYIYISAQKPM